ncbi:MAG: hypothetical protein V1753_09165 [Pseudomonadota bacterium]
MKTKKGFLSLGFLILIAVATAIPQANANFICFRPFYFKPIPVYHVLPIFPPVIIQPIIPCKPIHVLPIFIPVPPVVIRPVLPILLPAPVIHLPSIEPIFPPVLPVIEPVVFPTLL